MRLLLMMLAKLALPMLVVQPKVSVTILINVKNVIILVLHVLMSCKPIVLHATLGLII